MSSVWIVQLWSLEVVVDGFLFRLFVSQWLGFTVPHPLHQEINKINESTYKTSLISSCWAHSKTVFVQWVSAAFVLLTDRHFWWQRRWMDQCGFLVTCTLIFNTLLHCFTFAVVPHSSYIVPHVHVDVRPHAELVYRCTTVWCWD